MVFKYGAHFVMSLLGMLFALTTAEIKDRNNTDIQVELANCINQALPYYNNEDFVEFRHYINDSYSKDSYNGKQGQTDKNNLYVLLQAFEGKKVVNSVGFGVESSGKIYKYKNLLIEEYLSYSKNKRLHSYISKKKSDINVTAKIEKIQENLEINYVGYLFIGWTIVTLLLMLLSIKSNIRIFVHNNEQKTQSIKNTSDFKLKSGFNDHQIKAQQSWLIIWERFVDCFNPIENTKGLFKTDRSVHKNKVTESKINELAFLDGLRTLAGLKVVYGHGRNSYDENFATQFQSIRGNLHWMIVDSAKPATYAVDIFFFLGAFLSVISFAKIMDINGFNVKEALKACFNRIYRLYFPILAIKMISLGVLHHIFDYCGWFDDLFSKTMKFEWYKEAPLSFETPLLYLNLDFSWYLMNDFAYFMILIIVFIVYTYRKVAAYTICLIIISFSIGINAGILTKLYNFNYGLRHYYCRAGPYFIGGLFGFAYIEYGKIRKNNTNTLSIQQDDDNLILGLIFKRLETSSSFIKQILAVTSLTTLFALWNSYVYSSKKNILRNVYTLALGILCFLMILKRLKGISKLLSHSIFTILSRLTFMIYLFHLRFSRFNMNYKYESSPPSYGFLIYLTTKTMLISIIMSILLTIMFEIPYANINSRLLCKRSNSKTNVKPKDADPTESELHEESKDGILTSDQSFTGLRFRTNK